MKIANRGAREYVKEQKPFEGSNLFGTNVYNGTGTQYVVYSYYTPIYVYEDGEEFINTTKYSSTTSRHMSQIGVKGRGIGLTGKEMEELVRLGAKLFKKRAIEKALG